MLYRQFETHRKLTFCAVVLTSDPVLHVSISRIRFVFWLFATGAWLFILSVLWNQSANWYMLYVVYGGTLRVLNVEWMLTLFCEYYMFIDNCGIWKKVLFLCLSDCLRDISQRFLCFRRLLSSDGHVMWLLLLTADLVGSCARISVIRGFLFRLHQLL
jgi:hypothetical protein